MTRTLFIIQQQEIDLFKFIVINTLKAPKLF